MDVAGSLLLRFVVAAQLGKPAIAGTTSVAVLGVLVGVAVVVSSLTEEATRHILQAAGSAEADRMGTALLMAISQELRPPFASADAAVSCLRCPGVQLTAEHHDQLLATVEEFPGQLARVAANLLDMSRQQAHSIEAMQPRDRLDLLRSRHFSRAIHIGGRTNMTGRVCERE
jgi:K+-sensing histidine kinase KdpD